MAEAIDVAAARYQEALESFVAGGGEAALERAYDIGRGMIGEGRGVVELAEIHGRALQGVLAATAQAAERGDGIGREASRFLAEALAPFEMTLRGFEELNKNLEVRVQQRTRELERAQAMFHQAQKMETVGRLAGGIAHDFNNLLSVMMMNTELVLATLPADDAQRTNIEEIFTATMRASALTRQLLAFSRKQILAPTLLSLGDVVTGLQPMLLRLIGDEVKIVTDLAPGLAEVRADKGQVEQVVMNLVVNARDAMPNGGTVTIRTAARGNAVVLSVADTGVGIAPEIRDQIFEPFFTTKTEGRGTGLGLATCYGIVRQSGGSITVQSEVGRGSRFDVVLPCADGDVVVPERAGEPVTAPRPIRILLVEDNPAVRRATIRTLEAGGHRVRAAASGEEALEILKEPGAASFDLLLTDIAMPGISGREAVERVHHLMPALRVLYTSGYSDDEILARGVSTSEIDFVQKPFRPADLLAKIDEILRR